MADNLVYTYRYRLPRNRSCQELDGYNGPHNDFDKAQADINAQIYRMNPTKPPTKAPTKSQVEKDIEARVKAELTAMLANGVGCCRSRRTAEDVVDALNQMKPGVVAKLGHSRESLVKALLAANSTDMTTDEYEQQSNMVRAERVQQIASHAKHLLDAASDKHAHVDQPGIRSGPPTKMPTKASPAPQLDTESDGVANSTSATSALVSANGRQRREFGIGGSIGGDYCERNGDKVYLGRQPCSRNLMLRTNCNSFGSGCATSSGGCAANVVAKIFAVADLAIALVSIATGVGAAIKTAVSMSMKAGAVWLAKKAIKASAKHLAKSIIGKIQETWFNRAVALGYTYVVDQDALFAVVADTTEAYATAGYLEQLKDVTGYEDVMGVVASLDPTGVMGVISAFKDESCKDVDQLVPAVGAPKGRDFSYEWVPVCAHSFSKNPNGIYMACAHANYKGGSEKRKVAIDEPAFYSASCKTGEQVGECTGDSTVMEAMIDYTMPGFLSSGSFTIGGEGGSHSVSSSWFVSEMISQQEESESGGAARNSIGEGFCAGANPGDHQTDTLVSEIACHE
jgi:hypothetical protein